MTVTNTSESKSCQNIGELDKRRKTQTENYKQYTMNSSKQLFYYNTQMVLYYSGTSNKGPSEKGTTSIQRTFQISPKAYLQYIFNFQNEDSSL